MYVLLDKVAYKSPDLYVNSYIGYFLDHESIAKQQLSKKLDFLEFSFDSVASLYRKGCPAIQIFKQLELKENWFVKTLSGGHLSKLNMVKSIIRDIGKR